MLSVCLDCPPSLKGASMPGLYGVTGRDAARLLDLMMEDLDADASQVSHQFGALKVSGRPSHVSTWESGQAFVAVEGTLQNLPDGKTPAGWVWESFAEQGELFIRNVKGNFRILIAHEARILVYGDRVGSRPTFYFYEEGHFSFSSDMFSLLKLLRRADLDGANLMQLLYGGACFSGHTTVSQVHALRPGGYLVFGPEGLLRKKYFNYRYCPNFDGDLGDAIAALDDALERSLDGMLRDSKQPLVLMDGSLESEVLAKYVKARIANTRCVRIPNTPIFANDHTLEKDFLDWGGPSDAPILQKGLMDLVRSQLDRGADLLIHGPGFLGPKRKLETEGDALSDLGLPDLEGLHLADGLNRDFRETWEFEYSYLYESGLKMTESSVDAYWDRLVHREFLPGYVAMQGMGVRRLIKEVNPFLGAPVRECVTLFPMALRTGDALLKGLLERLGETACEGSEDAPEMWMEDAEHLVVERLRQLPMPLNPNWWAARMSSQTCGGVCSLRAILVGQWVDILTAHEQAGSSGQDHSPKPYGETVF